MYTSPHKESFDYTCLWHCFYRQKSFDTEVHTVNILEGRSHEEAEVCLQILKR